MRNNGKRRPTHPGELLRAETLAAARLNQTELAARLGVSRRMVNDLIHERRAVTPDIAHRLSRLFNTTAEFWLRLQQAVDIWDTWQANRQEYDRLKPLCERGGVKLPWGVFSAPEFVTKTCLIKGG